MKHIRSHLIGIDQGTVNLFSEFESGGEMWTGIGPRERRAKVKFEAPYLSVPAVQVSLAMLDADNETNTRADVQAENVSKSGFEAVFRTWGDSRVARVRLNWTSIGEVRDPEIWDVS